MATGMRLSVLLLLLLILGGCAGSNARLTATPPGQDEEMVASPGLGGVLDMDRTPPRAQ